jgi:hypothetical protein
LLCGNQIQVCFLLIDRQSHVYCIDIQTFDLGQNTAGWCRLQFRGFPGPSGFGTYIRHGEILVQPVASAK